MERERNKGGGGGGWERSGHKIVKMQTVLLFYYYKTQVSVFCYTGTGVHVRRYVHVPHISHVHVYEVVVQVYKSFIKEGCIITCCVCKYWVTEDTCTGY